jgi:hypothetical protein
MGFITFLLHHINILITISIIFIPINGAIIPPMPPEGCTSTASRHQAVLTPFKASGISMGIALKITADRIAVRVCKMHDIENIS